MSHSDIISESIQYGNIFESLDRNFFSCQEFVDFLAHNHEKLEKEKLYLCFNALMRNFPSIYHYSNGKHILTYLPQDVTFYRTFVVLGGSPELPLNKDVTNETLWSLVFDSYSEYLSEEWNEDLEKIILLCDKLVPKTVKKSLFQDLAFLHKLFEYRCDKIVQKLPKLGVSGEMYNTLPIETDWFDHYPSILKYFGQYVDRVSLIKKEAPGYFDKYMEQYMNQLSHITLKDFELIHFDHLKKLCYTFPSQFSTVDVLEPFFRLNIYPIPIRAYILGMDICYRMPTQKQIDERLVHLSKVGIEQYAKEYVDENKLEVEVSNDKDTLFESVEDYVLFDRLLIHENSKVYSFSRPEFQKLFTDRKNFWTKQLLNYSDLYTIQLRNQICKSLNLPKSDTLKTLLEKGCEGKLFQEENEITPKPTTQSTSDSTTTAYYLYLLQSMLGLQVPSNLTTVSPLSGDAWSGEEESSSGITGSVRMNYATLNSATTGSGGYVVRLADDYFDEGDEQDQQ